MAPQYGHRTPGWFTIGMRSLNVPEHLPQVMVHLGPDPKREKLNPEALLGLTVPSDMTPPFFLLRPRKVRRHDNGPRTGRAT